MRAHQACAIESAALHNQNFQVFVLFACRTYLEKPAHIIDALLSYKNIKFRELNIGTYILDTPITDWLKLNDFYRSSFLMHHLSDLLRLLTLYRYGGIYLDMDVMLLRTFEDLHLNYACSMGNQSISNSILGLEPKGFGHQLAEWLLQDFRKNLVRDSFDSTEHKFLLRVLQEVCSTRNVTLMVRDPKRCKGFRVFNVSEFYEVPLKQSELLLDQNLASEMLERIKNSRIIHIWNRFSAKWPLKTDSKSAYMQLAAKHCPKVFKAAGDFFS
ncbi:lactosylceramide 4-alpha-galactosyltransferase-like [Drosophila navojoa]|uniref:lactosylceramide 4-alpha-galactosyltransferase-like n=1 Tax=Drosophila navojoa TaxID=7232 RepID=UPI0011BFD795|nr:lactosylceramide 4-alpha-galactosyltransferase-like [Drosophila navojoa]